MIISDDILLSCDNISKTYESSRIRTKVLKQVNIKFKKGSINLIYGKSGSGKTTLLNILADWIKRHKEMFIISEKGMVL